MNRRTILDDTLAALTGAAVVGLTVAALGQSADAADGSEWVTDSHGNHHLALHPVRILPPCAVEDASSGPVPCVWFAPSMGNGRGHSFRVYRDGHFKFITDRRAFQLIGECDADGPLVCKR